VAAAVQKQDKICVHECAIKIHLQDSEAPEHNLWKYCGLS